MSQILSSTAHLPSKDLRFEHVDVKLVSCPGRHVTSLRPCLLRLYFGRDENIHVRSLIAKNALEQSLDES